MKTSLSDIIFSIDYTNFTFEELSSCLKDLGMDCSSEELEQVLTKEASRYDSRGFFLSAICAY